MSKEDQKKMAIHVIDSLNTKLAAQVDDYCKCLQSGTIQSCQPTYVELCTTYDSCHSRIESASMAGLFTADEYKQYKGQATSLFDKKAACAKAAMARGAQ